jgi:DoxX-like family
MNRRTAAYWVTTGLFCLLFLSSGVGHLLRAAPMAEGMAALGYPPYMMTILGTAKVLGVLALLVPDRPLLKEWAYAGFSFDLLGATASHLFAGDPLAVAVRPLVVLGVGAASYLLRPASRRLDASPTLGRADLSLDAAGTVAHGGELR